MLLVSRVRRPCKNRKDLIAPVIIYRSVRTGIPQRSRTVYPTLTTLEQCSKAKQYKFTLART